jgi:hypothetical protein
VLASSIIKAMMTEAASTSETSINFYQTTRRYNPEDSHLHTRRRENLKSYKLYFYLTLLALSIILYLSRIGPSDLFQFGIKYESTIPSNNWKDSFGISANRMPST